MKPVNEKMDIEEDFMKVIEERVKKGLVSLLTVVELKKYLKAKGMDAQGKKDQLIQTILHSL